MTSTSRIDELDIKCTYLERATQELSDVLHRQQRQLDQALAQIEALRSQLEALDAAAERGTAPPDPRAEVPPHY